MINLLIEMLELPNLILKKIAQIIKNDCFLYVAEKSENNFFSQLEKILEYKGKMVWVKLKVIP